MKGFTLIELVVTLAILGLLASMAAPLVGLTVKRNKEQQLRVALQTLRDAIDDYHDAAVEGRIDQNRNGYPRSLTELVEGVADKRDPSGKKLLYFLRRIPKDPMTPLPDDTPPELSWGLRSFASPPDNPRPGEDVYDVYSLSEKTGTDGQPYRSW